MQSGARHLVALVGGARHERAEESAEGASVKRLRVVQWAARDRKQRVAFAHESRVVQWAHAAHPIDEFADGVPVH